MHHVLHAAASTSHHEFIVKTGQESRHPDDRCRRRTPIAIRSCPSVGRHSVYYLPKKNEPNEDCTPIHGGSDGGHYLLRLRAVVISFLQPKNNDYSFLRPPQLVGHLCRTHLEEDSQPVPKPTMGNRTRGEAETTTSHSRQCGLIS